MKPEDLEAAAQIKGGLNSLSYADRRVCEVHGLVVNGELDPAVVNRIIERDEVQQPPLEIFGDTHLSQVLPTCKRTEDPPAT